MTAPTPPEQARDGRGECGAAHPKLAEGNVCREPAGHDGACVARDSLGRPEYYWHRAGVRMKATLR
jgi:hypothetical protein